MDKIVEIFDIDLVTIGFTMIVLVIMVVAISFLIVFPVRKLMRERNAKAQEVYKENERLNDEVAKARQKYDALTKEASQTIAVMTKETAKAAEDKAQKIVDEAKKESMNIITAAKQEMEAERLRMEQYFKTHITSLAVDMAAKVLEREVTEKDNSKILDDCLNKWSN